MFQEGVGASHTPLRIIQLFYIIIVVITIDNRIIANIARIGKIGVARQEKWQLQFTIVNSRTVRTWAHSYS